MVKHLSPDQRTRVAEKLMDLGNIVAGALLFGQAVSGTRYVEVESGRVTIQFTNNLVSSISESEGLNFNQGPQANIPPYFPLF